MLGVEVDAKMKERISWLDIARGLGIIFVCLGHTYRKNLFQTWIYSFHMPLFFFISGYLLNEDRIKKIGWKQYFEKKVKTFLVPYFMFLFLLWIYWLAVESHFRKFDQGPLWFLISLFTIECIFNIIVRFCKQKKALVYVFLGFFIAFIICGIYLQENTGITGWIIRVMNGAIWYATGWIFSIIEKKEKKSKSAIVQISRCIMLLLVSLYVGIANGRVDMYMNRFHNIVFYISAAMFGIAFIVYISRDVSRNIVLEYFGRYSLVVLCTHEPIKRALIKIGSILLRKDSEVLRNNIVIGMVIVFLILLLEVIIIQIFRKLREITKETKLSWLFMFMK